MRYSVLTVVVLFNNKACCHLKITLKVGKFQLKVGRFLFKDSPNRNQ